MTEQSTEQSLVDELADDATPAELPAGAPTMTPFMKLPYRARGDFMQKLDGVKAVVDKQQKAAKPKGKAKTGASNGEVDVDLTQAGEFFYLLADIDELMRLVCDPDELSAWQAQHTDQEFVGLWNVYMRWSQVGEASSSSS